MSKINGASNDEAIVLTTESEYPLTVNGLQDIAAFEHTEAGLCLVSKISAPAGAHFAYITSHAPMPSPSWKTIQTSANTHTDPRSALLYMNHSCAPSVEVHTYSPDANGKYPSAPPKGGDLNGESAHLQSVGLAGEVVISKARGIEPGDALTFFYPSTEWKFDRPFECLCGAPKDVCLGTVQGAEPIDYKRINDWFFNDHILQMKKQQNLKN